MFVEQNIFESQFLSWLENKKYFVYLTQDYRNSNLDLSEGEVNRISI